MNDWLEYQELYHHGIKGMHWGVRRYQNPDGTLTARGRKRYEKDLNKLDAKASQHAADADMYANRANDRLNRASQATSERKKNRLLKKAAKDRLKADKEYSKAKEYESEQWKGIGDALERGTNVTTQEKYRHNIRANNPGVGAAGIAGGAVGAVAASLIASAVFEKRFGKYYSESNTRAGGMEVKGNKFILTEGIPGQKGSMGIQVDLSKYFPEKKRR